jgi:DNA repair protein RadD
MTTAWPPQLKLLDGVREARRAGHNRILGVLPTGGGKTFCAATLVKEEIEGGGKVVFYTNRKLLLEQSAEVFLDEHQLESGIRAADYPLNRWLPFQLASIQSELSWLKKNTEERPDRHQLHKATLAFVDEAHINASAGMVGIMNRHVAEGCTVFGLTATPIDLGHAFDHMVVGGNNSDLRACGALVVAHHFAPDEPDLRKFKGITEGDDLTEKMAIKAVMTNGIFGRVYEHWKRLNPDARPTLGFGPGVRESLAFAEDFHKRGVRSAHIDGDDIWVDGEFHKSDRAAREQVMHDHRKGRITALWNRFVMREGVDTKWVEHLILATVFGSLQGYLQTGGRGLRACPETGKSKVVVQDHGGAFHKHGSLNMDREWNLDYTARMITGVRLDRMRAGKIPQPFVCRNCKRVMSGRSCLCGNVIQTKSRTVAQSDGTLIEMTGDVYTPRKVDTRTDAAKAWEKVYWRARKSKKGMTFKQAAALYAYENGWCYPPPGLPFMPTNEADHYRLVRDVDFKNLTSKPKGSQ